MRSYLSYFISFLVVMLVSGCVTTKPKSNVNTNGNNNVTVSSVYNYDKSLKQCINESDYLARKNKAEYGRINEALLQMLAEIKLYSSQLSQIDEKNKEIITSMYMFQVNDLCNTISQNYLFEVKKDLNKIVDKTKGN